MGRKLFPQCSITRRSSWLEQCDSEYIGQFGEAAQPFCTDDWDSTAWGEDWKALERIGADASDYEACLNLWRSEFYD